MEHFGRKVKRWDDDLAWESLARLPIERGYIFPRGKLLVRKTLTNKQMRPGGTLAVDWEVTLMGGKDDE